MGYQASTWRCQNRSAEWPLLQTKSDAGCGLRRTLRGGPPPAQARSPCQWRGRLLRRFQAASAHQADELKRPKPLAIEESGVAPAKEKAGGTVVKVGKHLPPEHCCFAWVLK